MCGLTENDSHFLLDWIKLDIEDVRSVFAQSAVLNVKYMPIPIFPVHHLIFFLTQKHAHLMKETSSWFSPKPENMSTVFRRRLSLTNQFQLSLYVLSVCRGLSWHFFFLCSSFLRPILVCNRLHNLLPLVLTENPLRKMPLIAMLPLVPFSIYSSSFKSFFFQIKAHFSPPESLHLRSALSNYNSVSPTTAFFAMSTFLHRWFTDKDSAWHVICLQQSLTKRPCTINTFIMM